MKANNPCKSLTDTRWPDLSRYWSLGPASPASNFNVTFECLQLSRSRQAESCRWTTRTVGARRVSVVDQCPFRPLSLIHI